MRFSFSWLKEFVEISTSSQAAEILIRAGFEVQVMKEESDFEGVVVGQVLKVQPIAGTHLKNCLVSDGKTISSIVCGAPNVQKDQFVAVAGVGAKLPGGVVIERKKIRGVVSNGMLCSEKELGIGEDSAGIMVLPGGTLGEPIKAKGEEIIEVEITANRGDCLSVYGIAREIALFAGLPLKKPDFPQYSGSANFGLEVSDSNCPYYSGFYISGVHIGESPGWLVKKLASAGLRSQNNVVDITNFILMELGQPLHAFDADKLSARKIVVSPSKQGEEILLISGEKCKLPEGMCLIRDGAQVPVALGGVMGGSITAISASTKNVFLESAFFTPESISKTSGVLGISTDSSMRFARGVDPKGVFSAACRAASLIEKIAGGLVEGFVSSGTPPENKPVEVREGKIFSILGENIPKDVLTKSFSYCSQINSESGGVWQLTPFSFRRDLKIEEDFAEEAARIYGYDKITPDYPKIRRLPYGSPAKVKFLETLCQRLEGLGLYEVITCDMISSARLLGQFKNVVKIKNPLSSDMDVMRPSLLPSLMDVLRRNVSRGSKDVRIFEKGKIFKKENGEVLEEEQLAAIITGRERPLSLSSGNPVDFYYVKGMVEFFCQSELVESEEINFPFSKFAYSFPPFATICEISQEALKVYDIKKEYIESPVFYFEVYLKNISPPQKEYFSPPVVPYLWRDISIVVDRKMKWAEIRASVSRSAPEHLSEIYLTDVYEGENLPEGKKSFTFRMFFRGSSTLMQSEVDGQVSKILAELSKLGAELRK